LAFGPATAKAAGVWVTLAAGLPGSATPTDSSEFQFDNPHGPMVAVNSFTGGGIAEAATGGGSSFFSGVGTPVLLNLANGSAYIASNGTPDGAKSAGGTPASAGPVPGGSVPSSAALLGVDVAPTNSGSKLTASVTDGNGNSLGSGSVNIPQNGWWVLGLNPNDPTQPTPPSDPGSPPPPSDPNPPTIPPPSTTPPGTGPMATPEPATFVLAVIGGAAAQLWRRSRLPVPIG
jgi:hypothetical protein